MVGSAAGLSAGSHLDGTWEPDIRVEFAQKVENPTHGQWVDIFNCYRPESRILFEFHQLTPLTELYKNQVCIHYYTYEHVRCNYRGVRLLAGYAPPNRYLQPGW